MNEAQYKAETVASKLGVSLQTLNLWYTWKRTNPEYETASLIPEYKQDGVTGARYWTSDDIKQLRKFKKSIIKGRNGIMGNVTQRYVRRNNDEKK